VLIGISPEDITAWRKGYTNDDHFSAVLKSLQIETQTNEPEYPQYFLSDTGLLYFEDAAGNNRLCVPASEQQSLISDTHDAIGETAHAG
ncbi:hypothetical protein PLICRDRAFT_75925, partial [Plicaturopsis crispa FD-325 SS-3]